MDGSADIRSTPPGSDLGSVLARIDQRRQVLFLSDRASSLAAGLSADALRNIRRQFREGDQSRLCTGDGAPVRLRSQDRTQGKDYYYHWQGPITGNRKQPRATGGNLPLPNAC